MTGPTLVLVALAAASAGLARLAWQVDHPTPTWYRLNVRSRRSQRPIIVRAARRAALAIAAAWGIGTALWALAILGASIGDAAR